MIRGCWPSWRWITISGTPRVPPRPRRRGGAGAPKRGRTRATESARPGRAAERQATEWRAASRMARRVRSDAKSCDDLSRRSGCPGRDLASTPNMCSVVELMDTLLGPSAAAYSLRHTSGEPSRAVERSCAPTPADTIADADRGAAPAALGACMELAFRTKKLRTLCQDHDQAVNEIGEPAAEILRTRIADLRAVAHLADLPVGRPSVVDGSPPRLCFVLRDGRALWMAVNHQTVPRTNDGELDVARVRRVRVEEIVR